MSMEFPCYIPGKFNVHSIQELISRSKGQIMKGLEIAKQIYETRGFNTTYYHGDNEFYIQALLPGILSICASD